LTRTYEPDTILA